MSFVIGIAGGSGSGKSTLANALVDALGPNVLHIVHDRYYRNLPATHRQHPESYNFDHPDALNTEDMANDLRALLTGKTVQLPQYDFATHTRTTFTDAVTATPIIIVEGILVMTQPALRDLFDLSVFVDTPDDVRLQRRIIRDKAERGRTEAQVREQVAKTVGPMHHQFVQPSANNVTLIVSGQDPIASLINQVIRHIPKHH